jgi:hypothetical protein
MRVLLRKVLMRTRVRLAVFALFILVNVLLVVGIGGVAQSGDPTATGIQQAQKAEVRGSVKIAYQVPKDPRYVELQGVLKGSRLFDEVAAVLNKKLTLPRDLPVRFAECGDANALYDPRSKSITMCYELIVAVAQDFSELGGSKEEVGTATLHTALFVFFHEIGHALVDILKLPVTGKEEDAVDQLATVILIESGDEGEEAALDGATWFLLRAEKTDIRDLAFWGEHSFDAQRFYNIACWVYGRDPKKHAALVSEGDLPQERAARCTDEYQQMYSSWTKLLSPYLKN